VNAPAPKPLDNYPVIRSRNIEELRDAFGRVYAKPDLLPGSDVAMLDATLNNCRLRHIHLAYVSYGSRVRFTFPASGMVSQLVPLRGSGEIVCRGTTVTIAPGTGAVTPPDVGNQADYAADFEQLVLRFEPGALTEKLAALTGATIGEPLRIGPRQEIRHATAQMLQQYLPILVDTLGLADPPFPEWWVVQTEQLLMTLFLFGYRHNYSHLLELEPPDTAPSQVRRAEDYIAANAHRGVTMEELARITGVSAFSLFRSFKKSRGYSPSEFAAKLRGTGNDHS
jgi:hypothetical protein